MSIKDLGGQILNKAWEAYSENLPRFTMHSTIAGWTLAVASNVFGVAIDKKIDTKEKKYLIPREIGDGAANILLFLCMTSPLTKFVNKLVDNNKIIFKGNFDKNILKGGLGVGASLLGAVVVSNVLAPIIRNVFAAKSQKKYLEKNQTQTEVLNPVQTSNTAAVKTANPANMQVFLTNIHSGNLRV